MDDEYPQWVEKTVAGRLCHVLECCNYRLGYYRVGRSRASGCLLQDQPPNRRPIPERDAKLQVIRTARAELQKRVDRLSLMEAELVALEKGGRS